MIAALVLAYVLTPLAAAGLLIAACRTVDRLRPLPQRRAHAPDLPRTPRHLTET